MRLQAPKFTAIPDKRGKTEVEIGHFRCRSEEKKITKPVHDIKILLPPLSIFYPYPVTSIHHGSESRAASTGKYEKNQRYALIGSIFHPFEVGK